MPTSLQTALAEEQLLPEQQTLNTEHFLIHQAATRRTAVSKGK
jgi:hypothetical protein